MQRDIEERRTELAALVERYASNHDEYVKSAYGETALRVEFLDPFFSILGWDVNNEAGLSIYSREVIHEASIVVDDEEAAHASKKPDYAFRIGGETRFFLEAKKPSIDILGKSESAFQARRYGWNGKHSIVVLSNFEDLSIYDCGYRPTKEQKASFARLVHFHYDELVERFDEIYRLISREAVMNGSLENVNAGEQAAKVPFDDLFLGQISSWRADITLDVYTHYLVKDWEKLSQFVQTLLNRIIFLRVCEDREFESEEELLSIATYDELREAFAEADEKYDSGLFRYLEDAPWKVSDSLLVHIFQDLYYPNSSYNFNVVQPHVIGHIYEAFLSERVYVEDGRIRFETTPEAIESNGVVPTPKEITDAIVANALCDVALPCRVADICCGSGNFLLSVYEYLVSKELSRVIVEGDDDIELIERPSGFDLPFWRKRQIMVDSIYGVDLDPRAVEVAQFSLSLRLLEGCGKEELEAFRAVTGERLLPDMSKNIKCGNSVVGYCYFKFDKEAIDDIDTLYAVRPFDWKTEFSFGGFDAIVGNPPYIRVQNLAKYIPKEYGFYKSSYCDLGIASAPLLDKYMLFVERALSLLNADGKLGMIIPNKFMTIETGKQLRTLLTSNYHVERIIDFGTVQVFPGRSTYTCILVAAPGNSSTFTRWRVHSLHEFMEEPLEGGSTYSSSNLTGEAWSFLPEVLSKHVESIKERCSTLSELANIFVGLQTSNDAAYIIEPVDEADGVLTFVDLNGCESKVESAICRPCLLDVAFEAYGTPKPNRRIIFPYAFENGKPRLVPLDQIELMFPNTYAYLLSIRDILEKRSLSGKSKGNDWYRFGRSQSLSKFSGRPHLIWPVLSVGPKYMIDKSGTVMFTGGGNGPYYGLELKDDIPESIEYVQAVLSYWYTEQFVRNKTSVFRGDYYAHSKQFIAALPIRRVNFGNSFEANLHNEVTRIVQTLNELVSRRAGAESRNDVELLSRSIAAIEDTLNEIMNMLYDITSEFEKEVRG